MRCGERLAAGLVELDAEFGIDRPRHALRVPPRIDRQHGRSFEAHQALRAPIVLEYALADARDDDGRVVARGLGAHDQSRARQRKPHQRRPDRSRDPHDASL
jgi:hypothetical protein